MAERAAAKVGEAARVNTGVFAEGASETAWASLAGTAKVSSRITDPYSARPAGLPAWSDPFGRAPRRVSSRPMASSMAFVMT